MSTIVRFHIPATEKALAVSIVLPDLVHVRVEPGKSGCWIRTVGQQLLTPLKQSAKQVIQAATKAGVGIISLSETDYVASLRIHTVRGTANGCELLVDGMLVRCDRAVLAVVAELALGTTFLELSAGNPRESAVWVNRATISSVRQSSDPQYAKGCEVIVQGTVIKTQTRPATVLAALHRPSPEPVL